MIMLVNSLNEQVMKIELPNNKRIINNKKVIIIVIVKELLAIIIITVTTTIIKNIIPLKAQPQPSKMINMDI